MYSVGAIGVDCTDRIDVWFMDAGFKRLSRSPSVHLCVRIHYTHTRTLQSIIHSPRDHPMYVCVPTAVHYNLTYYSFSPISARNLDEHWYIIPDPAISIHNRCNLVRILKWIVKFGGNSGERIVSAARISVARCTNPIYQSICHLIVESC